MPEPTASRRRAELEQPLGELSLHILIALGHGAAHGYAIGREIEKRSGGRLKPTTGALYQALRRLQQGGLLTPAPRPDATVDARRKYFRITPRGRAAVESETARLERLIASARSGPLVADGS